MNLNFKGCYIFGKYGCYFPSENEFFLASYVNYDLQDVVVDDSENENEIEIDNFFKKYID